MDGTPKYSKVNQNVLADFALTMQESPNLTEKEILSKFPEFDNDINAVHSALDYVATVQGGIPKDISTKFPEFNFGGTNPAEKKKDTASNGGGTSSGLLSIKFGGDQYQVNPKTQEVFMGGKRVTVPQNIKDYIAKNMLGVKPTSQPKEDEWGNPLDQGQYRQPFTDRQQAAIGLADAPDVQSEKIIKRNKKFPSFSDNPQIGAALDAYKNLQSAAANTADARNNYDSFNLTGSFFDDEGNEIKPLGTIPTDRLGTTAIVGGSPAELAKKDLEQKLKTAKQDEDIAYNDLGNKENTFRNAKLPELPFRKELGADKYEYEMPSQVKVLNFMDGMSKLEDYANNDLGMSLKQYSDSIEKVSSNAFLTPTQQVLFDVLNSGDEKRAKAATASYDEDINKKIDSINKMLASGVIPSDKRGYWINERQALVDQKSDFFSPKKAIEGAMTINPQLKPIFDAFTGIGDQDKASLVYAKVFKDSQDISQNLTGQPLFIEKDGKQVLNPQVENYLLSPPKSAAKKSILDQRDELQKNINTLKLLAPATLLNRRPLEKKGSFIESFGKTIAKGIGYDTGFTQTMLETDKPSVISNFLADATISTKDLPTNQAKQLGDIGKQSNWEFAGSTLGYLIPAGVQLAVGGAELRGLELIANALKRTSTAANLAADVIKITRGSSMLNKAVKMGAEAQLGGWTFNDPEMGFANIGAESLAGELFEKGIKKLPGGALVTKVAKKVFADNYLTAMNKIGKANAYGLGETTGEFAGSLVQLYQDSDTWNDFYNKFQQQFGKADENLKFFLSCYSLGMVTGNHAAPATKAIDSAADKAYQKLTPDEKKIADEVVENDIDATNVATVDVLRNNVQVVPDADLKTRIEQVKKAKADLDALPDLKANTQNAGNPYVVPAKQGEVKNAKDGAYEIKVGDITFSGNTPEQLENDKDLINSLDLIYSGEQQRREAEGITVETPPIAEADQTDVEQPKPEAGVGVGESSIGAPETAQNAQESGQNGDLNKGYSSPAIVVKELNREGDNKLLEGEDYEYQLQRINKTIEQGVKAGESTEDIMRRLSVNGHVINLGSDSATVNNFIQNKIDGKETRTFGEFAKDTRATPTTTTQTAPTTTATQTQPSDTANLPQDVQDKIAKLRADEQTALRNALPNYKNYLTDGKVDDKKITDDADLAKFNKIYDQYNAPITALFESGKNQPQEGEVKEVVSDTQVSPLKDVESTVKALDNTKDKTAVSAIADKIGKFNIKGLKKFFHASDKKRKGRLVKSNAPQFGTGVYFSTNKDLVKNEFGEEVTEVSLNLQNPVKTGTPEWNAVEDLAIKKANEGKQVDEDGYIIGGFSDIADIPSRFISDAAAELGYDAIVDEDSKVYDNEITVLDESRIIYAEDLNKAIAEAYHKAKADKSNPDLVNAVEELLAPKGEAKAEPSVKAEAKKEAAPTEKVTPTTAERKAEVAARVDKLADKIKAKLGTDPNVVKMGLGADDVVDFIAEVVKDLANLGIDAAEAIKTAKAKLKELGVDEDLINEAEAKYTGKETKKQAIPTESIDNVADKAGIAPKNLRDLYNINRTLFGLNKVKSLAAAVAMDRMVGVMAKRAGITKSEMYARLRFKKASETDLPQGVKMQVDAWHGSPYEFDKFTTEKIGTGEGAQAFGWGLYFTDLKGIAENYAKQLSALNSKILIDGKEQIMIPDHVLYIVKDILEANGGDIEKTIEAAKDRMEGYSEYLDFAQSKNSYNKFDKAIKYLEKNKEKVKLIADRNLYKVSLHEGKAPSDYTWLEWDKKPNKEQVNDLLSKLTQEQLDKGFYYGLAPDATNGTLYKNLAKALGGDKQASIFLLENGIDGVKYPAESISRGATSDTARGFNYVVFDENAVSVKDVIKFQKDANKARGAVMVTMDGNAVIYALTDPNVSTPLHEVAHVFEHYLTDSERATVNNWAKTGAWTTETSEKFARGFEKYLSEGVAPTEGLKKVFEKFKTWLTDIYNGIKGSNIDIELNDDMRSIYAQMLGEDAVPPQKAKAAPKKVKKAAIQSDVIDNLVKGAKRGARQAAINSITDTKVKEVATVVSDTDNRFKKIMDAINNDEPLLLELQEKLGFKKICQ